MTTSIVFEESILESEGMSHLIWEPYLSLGIKKNRKSGDYIIDIGENLQGLYYVHHGRIVSNLLGSDGVIKTVSIVGEHCLFGTQFVFHNQPSLFEAVVIEDSELYFFDKETIYEIMKKDFAIAEFIMKYLAIRSRALACQLEDTSLRTIVQSISRILYTLCCYETKNGAGNEEIILNLSHQDLANMVASHRVTVTKNLNVLKKQGILDYKYEKIIIKNPHKLKEIALE
ncbi:MAG: Crp/Fnr family transcriptional regulator [Peptococcales bacterium]|jgi:CRP/FNR family cyclic AMP-dependent transcriptional regulator